MTLDPLTDQLRANPRLRWGLAAIIAIIWSAAILNLRDSTNAAAKTLRASDLTLARTTQDAADRNAQIRTEQALGLRNQLYDELWKQPTLGLAQARFQEWLNQELQRIPSQRRQVTLRQPASAGFTGAPVAPVARADDASPFWPVHATIEIDFDPAQVYALLGRLATAKPRVNVEGVLLRKEPNPRAELNVVAYFLKPVGDLPSKK